MLPVSIDPFVIVSDPSYDLYIGKSSELFFARASARKDVWDNDFISNFARMVNSQLVKLHGINFGFVMTKFLEQKGVRVKSFDETSFGLRIGNSNVNQSLGGGKQIVFWSKDMAVDLVQKRLQEIGIWVIIDDSSCKAVVCHQS